jgi:hypothetical protein
MGTVSVEIGDIYVQSVINRFDACYTLKSKGNRHSEGFRDFRSYKFKGKDISIAWNSFYSFWGYGQLQKASDLKITFHLSQFKNYKEFKRTLKYGLGRDYSKLLNGRVLRFDAFLDIKIPLKLIDSNFYQKYVRQVDKWKSGTGTIYFGNKPKITCFCEKNVSPDKIDYKRPKKKSKEILCVRIEVRHFKNKLPIRTFREIKKIYEIDLFSHLIIDDTEGITRTDLKKNQLHRIMAFQKRKDEVGHLIARREFNENGNFDRSIGRFLRPLNIDLIKRIERR